jgi:hypothetical protein
MLTPALVLVPRVAAISLHRRCRQKSPLPREREHSVYAFDADSPAQAPLWHVSVGASAPVPNPWFGEITSPPSACTGQTFNLRETGITSTPVIDPTTETLYVVGLNVDPSHPISGQTCIHDDPTAADYCVSYACSQPTIEYRLHALDLRTGVERAGSPVVVAATAKGSGWQSKNGTIAFDARQSLQRAALLFDYGTIYFGTGSYSDENEYHGWIFAYDAATLAQKAIMNDTPGGHRGGIWMSGRKMVSDHEGYVYVVTGNGSFSVNVGGADYGDSVVKLDANTLEVKDWFSPFNSDYDGQNFLDAVDQDLGSAGATFIPNTTLLLASGKTGKGYLLDRDQLGHFNSDGDDIVQTIRLAWEHDKTQCSFPGEGQVYGTPVVWQGPDGTHVYAWGSYDHLRDYLLDSNGFFPAHGVCFCHAVWYADIGSTAYPIRVTDPPCGEPKTESTEYLTILPGAMLSVSSYGKESNTALVWATYAQRGDAIHHSVPGYLAAFSATSVSEPLWSSGDDPTRDGLGNWAKFVPPTVVNGKVYVATQSGQLVVYGLR